MKLLALRSIFALAAVAGAAPAAVAHDDCFRAPVRCLPVPSIEVRTPLFSIRFGGRDRCVRPIHEHVWSYAYERVWIEPLYENLLVGYDCCGRPIYDRVLVRCGYWTSVRCRVCGCGARIRG